MTTSVRSKWTFSPCGMQILTSFSITVLGDLTVEQGNQGLASGRRLDGIPADDLPRADRLPVQALVGVTVLVQRSAFERHAREQPFGPRISQDVGPAYRAGSSGGAAGPGGRRRVAAHLGLVLQHRFDAFLVHDQENVIGGRTADLEAEAGAADAVHGRRRPV